jgi:uncharacterized protein with HEPN domain
MQPRDLDLRLLDILNSARKILSRAGDLSAEDLRQDEWTLDAVLHNLAVIGEASARLPDDFLNEHPEVAWREMRDMRNLLIHGYFGVDVDLVWNTIQHDLPTLIEYLSRFFGEA